MVEKYEEKFWGKIDFLHEKSKQEHNSLNVLSDIIIKFSNIISDFSKSIDNIKNRKVKIVDDKDSSVYKLSYCFKQNLKVHIDEFKECSNHMKLTIIDSMIMKDLNIFFVLVDNQKMIEARLEYILKIFNI